MPFPVRSARSSALSGPVIRQSAAVAESSPLIDTMRQLLVTSPEHVSVALKATATGTILLFGGHSDAGDALAPETAGGTASTTLTLAMHELVSPSASTACNVTRVVPSGYGPAGACARREGIAIRVVRAVIDVGLRHRARLYRHVLAQRDRPIDADRLRHIAQRLAARPAGERYPRQRALLRDRGLAEVAYAGGEGLLQLRPFLRR